ncbi:formyltransferase family protein [Candidatus Venteria ishoeyi]|uniref:formyltransferase family protein n=1 Tax=Candidatus Venteria ishoeyi TaxID=1899563 RepID=UPI0025A54FFC|nr:formyltransferase family protein [Candidatus Venteria ishoeyi]MDM8547635.1 formyltransferase family protein [Candidatus Venteria ishoeyi]
MKRFYLLIDCKFFYCFLTNKWIEQFANTDVFLGILIRETRPNKNILQRRMAFHSAYAGHKELTPEMEHELTQLYEDFGEESKAAISCFGIPPLSTSNFDRVRFMGNDLNSQANCQWLQENIQNRDIWLFSRVGQILKKPWLDACNGRLVNMHGAILPYARGTNAIQQIARQKDIKQFSQAAGVTIHYIDSGVDTGNLIRSERISDPFQYKHLWELTAHINQFGCDIYTRTALEILQYPYTYPAGIPFNISQMGKNHRRKEFDLEAAKEAEQAYQQMKLEHQKKSTSSV